MSDGLLTETLAIFSRWTKKTLRRPTFLFFTLVQPIVWFVLFTQAFSRTASIPGFSQAAGTSSYVTFFSAAVIIQTVITSAMQSGMGIVTDMESGYLDKMRVSPIHRSAILLGKGMSDAVRIMIQTLVILGIGLVLGVTFATGVFGVLLILVIAALFGIAWSGISNTIALATKNSEMTLMISILTTFPLLFLSTSMMPYALLPPGPVQTFAGYNPISYVADALHSLVITGFDWTILGYTFATILAVGVITVGSATMVFRRAVSA